VTLPRLLHADGGFRLVRQTNAEWPQLSGAAHHAVEEKTVHDGIQRNRQIDVAANEIVGYAAAKPAVPAFRVKPQHMVAVFVRFADPQFADHAAFGKNVLHPTDLLTLSSKTLPIASSAQVNGRDERLCAYVSNRNIMLCGGRSLASASIEQHACIPYTHA
jgi:hypothetical protein